MNTSDSDPIDFDYKVSEGITHLDVSPNLFQKVDFSSLARCSRTLLPVLVTITSESGDNGGDKDLGISDDWIADNVAIHTRSSHGVWQPSFSTILKCQLPSSSPRTGLLLSTLQSNLWLTECCELTRLCSLANVSRFASQIKFASRILVAASERSCLMISFNLCWSRLLLLLQHYMISSPRDVLIVLCQLEIRDLVTAAAHRFSSSLLFCLCCTSCMYSWCREYANSSAISSSVLELPKYHNWCQMPEYKYWTLILFTELTVLEKMGCWSIDLLPLAKFYDYVCSAVILISLNSVINRRPAVISLNAWGPLVFERPFVVTRLLRLFPVGIPWIRYSVLSSPCSRQRCTLVHEGATWLW